MSSICFAKSGYVQIWTPSVSQLCNHLYKVDHDIKNVTENFHSSGTLKRIYTEGEHPAWASPGIGCLCHTKHYGNCSKYGLHKLEYRLGTKKQMDPPCARNANYELVKNKTATETYHSSVTTKGRKRLSKLRLKQNTLRNYCKWISEKSDIGMAKSRWILLITYICNVSQSLTETHKSQYLTECDSHH